MNNTLHTPAPWKHDSTWGIIKHGKSEICALHSGNLANARLISAAPELLSALEAIQARINGEYDCPALVAFGSLHYDKEIDCLRIAKEAIAKAKGEA